MSASFEINSGSSVSKAKKCIPLMASLSTSKLTDVPPLLSVKASSKIETTSPSNILLIFSFPSEACAPFSLDIVCFATSRQVFGKIHRTLLPSKAKPSSRPGIGSDQTSAVSFRSFFSALAFPDFKGDCGGEVTDRSSRVTVSDAPVFVPAVTALMRLRGSPSEPVRYRIATTHPTRTRKGLNLFFFPVLLATSTPARIGFAGSEYEDCVRGSSTCAGSFAIANATPGVSVLILLSNNSSLLSHNNSGGFDASVATGDNGISSCFTAGISILVSEPYNSTSYATPVLLLATSSIFSRLFFFFFFRRISLSQSSSSSSPASVRSLFLFFLFLDFFFLRLLSRASLSSLESEHLASAVS
mmetsp:Transcript_25553/g.75337  ORF Transcript_25553/g.75337 Transcript_25553/m.75337 type:complete len:357 (+) Transcript_25553:2525-3595(+)